jgi:hypothetical protein
MKKIISLVVIISLLITSQPAQANFFTDLFGGLFTIVSYPIQLILGSTKAPFFVSQNPFVEKEWHKEERLAAGRKAQDSTPAKEESTVYTKEPARLETAENEVSEEVSSSLWNRVKTIRVGIRNRRFCRWNWWCDIYNKKSS